ncbi:glycosyltransferase family protein [Natronobacterium gregoryi]|uniref:Cell wall biogenesis glycosyltransferase n=2 Tax=Natronobacterium gregoryi TaxID=44930 RepID=L0ADA3_NATGS|nr:hypothetical protein [Natronobacterium gregoryi]AFZ71831.1 hypothetical protein Natgr_0581 [Natronobacterium gregoryi SP2]ELY72995.1 cell wall biogenesis glycosyltransferase [Natronobacterium gregoryi SP2]PLK19137.1 glycosyl transferase family 2 [Natronobacterium gregoryi SP2]SFJ60360.1 glucosyl-3-phosphoglycerate synthase [Natronobacterium gregoryi]
MEYVQERIATLHDFAAVADADDESGYRTGTADSDLVPDTAIVVPMTERELGNPAAERVLDELERLEPAPAAVFVPLRCGRDGIEPFREWLASFSLPTQLLWCNAPAADRALERAGIGDEFGKGRDVWLALGPAAEAGDYVLVHDADARSYEAEHVHRLLTPLELEFSFSKGYYARIEENRLYGRLFRLFYRPLVRALADEHDAPILNYLAAFRYALAGEFATTSTLARRLRTPPAWGLEVGTLGDAYDYAGFEGTAQVDLGRHVHDHRAVAGESGLEKMSREVGAELLRVLEAGGVEPEYETLPDRYRAAGRRLLDQYRADAQFNRLEYDLESERAQLDRYAESIAPPGSDRRLPRWTDTTIDPETVLETTQPWVEARPGTSASAQD